MDELIEKLKVEIIEHLNLDEITPEEVSADDQLFGGGFGLDSIDALELIVLLDKEYGIKISSQEEGKNVFVSLRTMAEYIRKKQQV